TLTDSSRMASTILRVSSGLGTETTRHPRSIGYQSVTVNPNEWKIGRHASMVAVSGRIDSDEICQQFARMLRCVSATPFGSPELPLVNRRPASWLSPRLGNRRRFANHWF